MRLLFVLVKPEDGNYDDRKWKNLLAGINPVTLQALQTDRLSENVWLTSMEGGLALFADLIYWAGHLGIPYQFLLVDDESPWVYSQGHPQAEKTGP